ncbi:DUF4192 domain-containing protein [Arthrobacter sp. LAPM80]|uniref:DUF4192 domain-containing protein n=1 Tax=Arthrobacter sp. LAPM80 TaxID=3141788 RepID=UPI00398A7245
MRKQIDKIRVSAGEDLLAFIPHMVGYWPEDSVVCIGMGGKRLRATMRLDLPPEDAVETGHFAAIAASQLASDGGADGCLIAIFGRRDWHGPGDCPHADLYDALRDAFEGCGLHVRDSWYVGPEHWRSLECNDAGCCPWPGKDNASIKESFINAEFIFRGSRVGDSPKEQIKDLIEVRDDGLTARVAAAGNDLGQLFAGGGVSARQLAAILGAWEFSLGCWPNPPDPAMAAFLLASLADGTARDAVIVALAIDPGRALGGAIGMRLLVPDTGQVQVPRNWYGGNQAAGCVVSIEDNSETAFLRAGRDFSSILIGEVGTGVDSRKVVGPDWARLDRAEPLLQWLARATDGRDKAPVLCLLGWIQWCKGRGTWAGNYFIACQQFQPGYRLAGMLEELLNVGYIAECAKDPQTAWRGYQGDRSDGQAA